MSRYGRGMGPAEVEGKAVVKMLRVKNSQETITIGREGLFSSATFAVRIFNPLITDWCIFSYLTFRMGLGDVRLNPYEREALTSSLLGRPFEVCLYFVDYESGVVDYLSGSLTCVVFHGSYPFTIYL